MADETFETVTEALAVAPVAKATVVEAMIEATAVS